MEEKQGTGLENQNLDNVGQNEEGDFSPSAQNDGGVAQNDGVGVQNDAEKHLDNVGQNEDDLYGAPESYDFKSLELPEGYQYEEEYGKKFTEVAKELNLSQKSANKLINVYVDILKNEQGKVPDALKEIKQKQVEADVAEWDKMLNQDTEIGNGNEEKINRYLDKANIGYKTFASEELKTVLSERGLTHNPAVIKLFYKLSDLAVEDKILTGGKVEELTPAQILYGNTSN